jgi:hypothetical protein
MDQDRLVPSCVPVFLYGEGCHPALELPLKPHRIGINTERSLPTKQQTIDDCHFSKRQGALRGVSGERWLRVHLPLKPHTESYRGIHTRRVRMCRRTVDRRPESILGALQLTASDELSVSAISLIDTPFDFRWYFRRGIPPSACSGAPGVYN